MRLLAGIFVLILLSFPVYSGLEKKIVTTNTFSIFLIDSTGNALTGGTLAGGVDIRFACAGDLDTAIDEAGDTLTEIDATQAPGYYWIATNDTLTGCTYQNEILVWATGTVSATAIVPRPRLAKIWSRL